MRRKISIGGKDPQVKGGGMAFEAVRGVRQCLGGLVLVLGMDDLGAPVAFRLGLTGDAPGIGDVVDDPLEPLVDLLPVDEQFVEVDRADRREGGLLVVDVHRGGGWLAGVRPREYVPSGVELSHVFLRCDARRVNVARSSRGRIVGAIKLV
ncbi:hypothetical protein QQY66_44485 [Streptomyces sp. DG2A-72]|uniref:hypothetical protein n=1 Tax=Streptomyces sp. DG2A-72 TaxID=3051386 RepID=UPI00265C73DC|nr:hypothetical protein [Streptomyces sp. DG2A-72]MDO0938444.1 hypothetical protein [Streptomyces sp. DG2A-72]